MHNSTSTRIRQYGGLGFAQQQPASLQVTLRSGTNEDRSQVVPIDYTPAPDLPTIPQALTQGPTITGITPGNAPGPRLRLGTNEDESQIMPLTYGQPLNRGMPPSQNATPARELLAQNYYRPNGGNSPNTSPYQQGNYGPYGHQANPSPMMTGTGGEGRDAPGLYYSNLRPSSSGSDNSNGTSGREVNDMAAAVTAKRRASFERTENAERWKIPQGSGGGLAGRDSMLDSPPIAPAPSPAPSLSLYAPYSARPSTHIEMKSLDNELASYDKRPSNSNSLSKEGGNSGSCITDPAGQAQNSDMDVRSTGSGGGSSRNSFDMSSSICRIFTPQQLAHATNNFAEENLLGRGAFGTVYKGRLSGCHVAVKRLVGGGWQGPNEYRMEVEVLSRMRHPHMVLLMGHCPETMSLVYEFLPGGSLQDFLVGNGGRRPLPWAARVRIMEEVASALSFLHGNFPPIAHRDLKPDNVLLDSNLISKVGDAGLARLLDDEENVTARVRGTAGFIDPEEVLTCEISVLSDIYAWGLMLLQLLTGQAQVKEIHKLMSEFMKAGGTKGMTRAVDVVMARLDQSGGEWKPEIARRLAVLALRCADRERSRRPCLSEEILPSMHGLVDAATAEMARRQERVDSQFICPLSKMKMEDPVVAADGLTYERSHIEKWLSTSDVSPVSGQPLPHKFLTPNMTMRMMMTQ